METSSSSECRRRRKPNQERRAELRAQLRDISEGPRNLKNQRMFLNKGVKLEESGNEKKEFFKISIYWMLF